MLDEEINKAISMYCGAKPFTDMLGTRIHTKPYTTDLNAMHEAEKTLNTQLPFDPNIESERSRYVRHLLEVCGDKGMVMATARQKAEAFLKTIRA